MFLPENITMQEKECTRYKTHSIMVTFYISAVQYLEKEVAIHSSILAWRISWMENLAGYHPKGCRESDTTGGCWAIREAQIVKNLPAMQETQVWSLSREDPLEKGMVIHANILAWRITWTEGSGRLQSVGSQSQTWLMTKQQQHTQHKISI